MSGYAARVLILTVGRPTHWPNIDCSLNPPNDDAVGQGPIDEIHAFEIELEHRFALNLGPATRGELEEAGETSERP